MKRVLIVDDNRMLANLYRSTIVGAGFGVEVAHDGEAAMTAARRVKPDLVLLDLMMPRMSGLEVLTALRADPTLGSVPVIVFSNSFTPERTEQLWQAGVTQLLVKASSSPRVVLDAIRTAIGDTGG
jgi:CheY-like chemotaxis protein